MGSGNSKPDDAKYEAKISAQIIAETVEQVISKSRENESNYRKFPQNEARCDCQERQQLSAPNSRLEPNRAASDCRTESSTLNDLNYYSEPLDKLKNLSKDEITVRYTDSSQPAHRAASDCRTESSTLNDLDRYYSEALDKSKNLSKDEIIVQRYTDSSQPAHESNPLRTGEQIQSTSSHSVVGDVPSTIHATATETKMPSKQDVFTKESNPLRTGEQIQSTSSHSVVGDVPSMIHATATEIKMPSKHDVFLKKTISSFDFKRNQQIRGFFCVQCDDFEIYYSQKTRKVFHDKSEKHISNLESVDGKKIKPHRCQSCHAFFFGNMEFWVEHINSSYHHIFHELKSNNKHRLNSSGSPRTGDGFDKIERISEIPTMSIFDALQEQTRTDYNMDTSKPDRCSKKVNYVLLVSDLSANTTKQDVFMYFKDFGFIDKMEMVNELSFQRCVKILFKRRYYAMNIVNNGWPCSINGKFVKTSLIEDENKIFSY